MSGRALHLVSDSVQAAGETGLDISEQELIAALREAQVQADGGRGEGALSARELSAALGWPYVRVIESLRSVNEAGRLEVVMVKRRNLIGRWQGIPCYRLQQD